MSSIPDRDLNLDTPHIIAAIALVMLVAWVYGPIWFAQWRRR